MRCTRFPFTLSGTGVAGTSAFSLRLQPHPAEKFVSKFIKKELIKLIVKIIIHLNRGVSLCCHAISDPTFSAIPPASGVSIHHSAGMLIPC